MTASPVVRSLLHLLRPGLDQAHRAKNTDPSGNPASPEVAAQQHLPNCRVVQLSSRVEIHPIKTRSKKQETAVTQSPGSIEASSEVRPEEGPSGRNVPRLPNRDLPSGHGSSRILDQHHQLRPRRLPGEHGRWPGFGPYGGYSEYLPAPAKYLIKIDKRFNIRLEELAPLTDAGLTP